MKKQNGITLIALIITIIVILILVAVTINVALNGGLFGKAKNAKKLTQVQIDKEALLEAVVASIKSSDAKVDSSDLNTNATNNGFSVTGSNFPYTCTSEKGNIFYVYEDGKISDTLIDDGNTYYNITFNDLTEEVLDEILGKESGKSLVLVTKDSNDTLGFYELYYSEYDNNYFNCFMLVNSESQIWFDWDKNEWIEDKDTKDTLDSFTLSNVQICDRETALSYITNGSIELDRTESSENLIILTPDNLLTEIATVTEV